jgi:Tfp pilus assembly protein PilP
MVRLLIGIIFIFSNAALARVTVDELFKNYTQIEKPSELRDPFKAPRIKASSGSKKVKNKVGSGVYSNIPTISNISINQLKIVGVLIGKVRRAIAKVDNSKETYILKEGMSIGANNAELRAIVPGGVILVEKISNIYGQEEFLETVIPISKEN